MTMLNCLACWAKVSRPSPIRLGQETFGDQKAVSEPNLTLSSYSGTSYLHEKRPEKMGVWGAAAPHTPIFSAFLNYKGRKVARTLRRIWRSCRNEIVCCDGFGDLAATV
ncbi:MAG: hypothetical protein MAG451_00581 [Anaerolineales bacterium]|nr:hypothetical protein [Anaerolineales bacterium]